MKTQSSFMALKSLLSALVVLCPLIPLSGAPGDLLWQQVTGNVIFGAPAIGPDGRIVVGSRDTQVTSFNPDGSLDWVFTGASDWIEASPTIAPDGTVYAGSWDAFLYALDGGTGALKWKFETGGYIQGSVALGPDGTIYLPSTDSFLYALNPDGTEKWITAELSNFSPISSSPVLSLDGETVYFGTDAGELFAVDAETGAGLWSFSVTDVHPPAQAGDPVAIPAPAAIGSDGRIFFTSENSRLYALNPDGTLAWSYQAAEKIRSAPVISADGVIHFAAQDGYLYALDTEGFQLWETFVGDVFYCTPAIDAAGNVIIGAYAGSATTGAATAFVSVDATGSINWEYIIAGYNDSSPNIAPDGSITIGAHDGALYKLEGNAGLMEGQWPRFQADTRQSGSRATRESNEKPAFEVYFPAISETAGDWALVPWFGAGWIAEIERPWVHHLEHGPVYLAAPTVDSVWFYDRQLGSWVYANAFFPDYYYAVAPEAWLFHLRGTALPAGRWFFNYRTGIWFGEPGS